MIESQLLSYLFIDWYFIFIIYHEVLFLLLGELNLKVFFKYQLSSVGSSVITVYQALS